MPSVVNVLWTVAICATQTAFAKCYDPSPAFPLPDVSVLKRKENFASFGPAIQYLLSDDKFNTSSFSIEITSSSETLWSYYHTAPVLNETHGVRKIDGNSRFRIASITKTFTTLALLHQHAAGNLSLDATIDQYIPELKESQSGSIPWKDITLRSLASQLSGIPREITLSDLITELPDPTVVGLPPVSRKNLLECDMYSPQGIPCEREDLFSRIKERAPLFAPNQKSTYSNVAFELLGLAIANVTGESYDTVLHKTVLDSIGMMNTTLTKPDDSVGAIPAFSNHWDYNLGIQAPTGALYSSPSDMSKYLRYVLTHYNGVDHALNWFQPASWGTGINSFYGIPWEIFQTSKILDPISRPTRFITKAGGLDGYKSIIMLVPEYDLGITILVAGTGEALSALRELITVPLIRSVDDLTAADINAKYSGTYVAEDSDLNTTLTLTASPEHGLEMTTFISNSTDVLDALVTNWLQPGLSRSAWRAQLVPTLLYKNQTSKPPSGELWRVQAVDNKIRKSQTGSLVTAESPIWDDFCITDVDQAMYAGVPLTEFVFWKGDSGEVESVDASGFRVKLRKLSKQEEQRRGPASDQIVLGTESQEL